MKSILDSNFYKGKIISVATSLFTYVQYDYACSKDKIVKTPIIGPTMGSTNFPLITFQTLHQPNPTQQLYAQS